MVHTIHWLSATTAVESVVLRTYMDLDRGQMSRIVMATVGIASVREAMARHTPAVT